MPLRWQRLERYFQQIGDVLGEESRRGSLALYAMGLLGDGERKSVEPLVARTCPDPKRADAMHPRLLHFAVDSKWSDRQVRRVAAQYALEEMTRREPVEAWMVDDTGFLKQGQYSVGVQRQYTGSAGKVAHCQMGVSLRVATRTEHLPLDFELYLPSAGPTTRFVAARPASPPTSPQVSVHGVPSSKSPTATPPPCMSTHPRSFKQVRGRLLGSTCRGRVSRPGVPAGLRPRPWLPVPPRARAPRSRTARSSPSPARASAPARRRRKWGRRAPS